MDIVDNYDLIVFVIKERGWKNTKLAEFIENSKYKIDLSLVDDRCIKKLKKHFEGKVEWNN